MANDLGTRIDDLVRRIERIVAQLNERLGVETEAVAAPAIADAAWEGFLGQHPELKPEPLRFTDDELIAALAEADRRYFEYDRPWMHTPEDRARFEDHRRAHPGIHSCQVADVIAGRPFYYDDGYADSVVARPTQGDVIRVGRALGRLAREGRVARVSKSWEANRYTVV